MPIAHEAIHVYRNAAPAPALESISSSYFDVYRADRVSLTSTLSSGGDWRWRFKTPSGATIAGSEGYLSEAECILAVDALRRDAGASALRTGRAGHQPIALPTSSARAR